MTDVKVPGYFDADSGIGKVGVVLLNAKAVVSCFGDNHGCTSYRMAGHCDNLFESKLPFPEFARRLAEALNESNRSESPKGSGPSAYVLGVLDVTNEQIADADIHRLFVWYVHCDDILSKTDDVDLRKKALRIKCDILDAVHDRIQRSFDQGREAGRKEGFEKGQQTIGWNCEPGRNPSENPATRPTPTPAPPMPDPVIPISKADLRTAKESWTPAPSVTDSPDAGQGVERDEVDEIVGLIVEYGTSASHCYWKAASKALDQIRTRLTELAGQGVKRFRPAPSREEIAGMDAYELCAELLNRIHGEHFDGDNGHRLLAIRDRILELAGPRKVKVTVRNYGNCWMGAISDEMFTSTFDLPEQVKESVSRCFAPLGLVPEFVE